MLFSWFIRSVPRSVRAFLALLVMLGGVSLAFNGLTALFIPGNAATGKAAVQFFVGLAIGLPATGVFYYFQHLDSLKRHNRYESEVEILNRYAESERQERIYKESKATPVFTSHSGAVKPANQPGAKR